MQGSNKSNVIYPLYLNELTGQYDSKTTDDHCRFFIKEYSPIRIKMLVLVDKINLNRVILDKHTLILFSIKIQKEINLFNLKQVTI